MKKFRILSQNGNYYPQYRYWLLPFIWFNFGEIVHDKPVPDCPISRDRVFDNETDATLFLVNQGVYEFAVVEK